MIQKILVPVDFSAPSRAALEYAAGLCRITKARLAVVHVLEVVPYASPADVFGAAANLGMIEAEQRQIGERELARTAGRLEKRGLAVETVLGTGSAARTIIDTAKRVKASLIVMATHGRTGLSHLLMGSVAERVLREASCPVLTLRPKASRGAGSRAAGRERKRAPSRRRGQRKKR